jgi:hypothetical protein
MSSRDTLTVGKYARTRRHDKTSFSQPNISGKCYIKFRDIYAMQGQQINYLQFASVVGW